MLCNAQTLQECVLNHGIVQLLQRQKGGVLLTGTTTVLDLPHVPPVRGVYALNHEPHVGGDTPANPAMANFSAAQAALAATVAGLSAQQQNREWCFTRWLMCAVLLSELRLTLLLCYWCPFFLLPCSFFDALQHTSRMWRKAQENKELDHRRSHWWLSAPMGPTSIQGCKTFRSSHVSIQLVPLH